MERLENYWYLREGDYLVGTIKQPFWWQRTTQGVHSPNVA